jgi:hypothetical protein
MPHATRIGPVTFGDDAVIVGVDFGAPQRARDQRRKIIAIAAQATDWRRYRIDARGINARLLARDPPG